MKRALILLTFFSLSCDSTLTSDELLRYAQDEESGLLQRVEKSNTVLEVYYKPKELIIQQELQGISDPLEQSVVRLRLDTLDYFVLRLSRGGKEIETSYASQPAKFNEAINYMAYYMAEDLTLIHGTDTLPVLDQAYTRSFGAADATSMMAVFNSNLKDKTGTARLIFDDRRLGTGLTEFDFNTKDIKRIPALKQN